MKTGRAGDRLSPLSDPRRLIEYARHQVAHVEPALPNPNAPELPEDAFPGYRLIAPLRRGGQGAVYLAEQIATGRTVAIKVLRSAPFAPAGECLRFQREIHALSQLKHPNIVTLYDGGTMHGHPYLVMDYIEGVPIDAFVRERELSVREVLGLFLKVCRAIETAHQQGIIHRDLKPANILVTSEGEPFVLDFGLAKLLHVSLSHEQSVTSTASGQFLGSLCWASPEQATGATNRIDVRTDVHALGLILFRLLTGRLPFEVDGPLDRTLRAIAREEAPPPSRFRSALDEDLDTIVLTCLAKEREQRYPSVSALIRDVEHYLAGRPIEAKRDSTWYVLTKKLRHHRRAVAALTAVMMLTMLYGLFITQLYHRTQQAERQARRTAVRLRDSLDRSQRSVELLVNQVARQLADLEDAEQPRRLILEQAYAELEQLLSERRGDPALLIESARTLRGLGDIDEALGRYEQGLERFRDSLDIYRRLAEEHPDDAACQADLSIAMVRVGDMAKALGRLGVAQDYYERALRIDQALEEAHPDETRYLDNLLWSYDRLGHLARRSGRLQAARTYFRKQLSLAEKFRRRRPHDDEGLRALRAAHGQLAEIAAQFESWAEALQHARRVLEISEQQYRRHPNRLPVRRRLAAAYLRAAPLYAKTGEFRAADRHAEAAKALIDPLLALRPDSRADLRLLRQYHQAAASIASARTDSARCSAHRHALLDVLDRLAALRPEDASIKEKRMTTLAMIAAEARRHEEGAKARACCRQGRSIARELMKASYSPSSFLEGYLLLLEEGCPDELRDPEEIERIYRLVEDRKIVEDFRLVRRLARHRASQGEPDKAFRLCRRWLETTGMSETPAGESLRAEMARWEQAAATMSSSAPADTGVTSRTEAAARREPGRR
ncbi:MAG: serine/threonine protein kinase [Planctomycetota bacterium]|nr:MAG: serine/threonine protein kinase [Planctomycetota bacterium]